MIFVANNIKGQKSQAKSQQKTTVHWPDSIFKKPIKHITNNSFKESSLSGIAQLPIFRATNNYINSTPFQVISADFYSRHFGFFCKKELEFEQKTKIPLRFRLGSLRYNDYLEGKPNAMSSY